jgi:hypothetical protein
MQMPPWRYAGALPLAEVENALLAIDHGAGPNLGQYLWPVPASLGVAWPLRRTRTALLPIISWKVGRVRFPSSASYAPRQREGPFPCPIRWPCHPRGDMEAPRTAVVDDIDQSPYALGWPAMAIIGRNPSSWFVGLLWPDHIMDSEGRGPPSTSNACITYVDIAAMRLLRCRAVHIAASLAFRREEAMREGM